LRKQALVHRAAPIRFFAGNEWKPRWRTELPYPDKTVRLRETHYRSLRNVGSARLVRSVAGMHGTISPRLSHASRGECSIEKNVRLLKGSRPAGGCLAGSGS